MLQIWIRKHLIDVSSKNFPHENYATSISVLSQDFSFILQFEFSSHVFA